MGRQCLHKKVVGLAVVLVWLGWSVAAGAEVFQEITAPDLKEMLDSGQVVLVNVLSKIEFDIQHIPGSINIPITTMQETARLPADKVKPLAFHCLSDR